ncbi:hypothetical protein C8Q75DRAFT_513823 [Abortiporus biennis]|nr:hypothetical protein C8Q75DRAFT_513823 [Abortiporus biennis]
MKRHEQPGSRIMEKKFQRMWRWKEHEKPPLPPILIHIFLWGDLTSPQRLQSMLDLPNTSNLLDGYFYGGAMKMCGTDPVVIDTAPQDNKSIMKGKILVMTGDTENARKLKLFEQYLGDHFRRHEKYLYFADGSTLGFGSVFLWVGNRDQLQKWSDCRIPTLEENTLKSFPGDSDTALERIVPSIKNLEERTQFLDKARDIATQYHRGSPAPVLPQPAVVNLLTSGVDLLDFLTIVGSLPPIKLLRISATVLAGQLVNQIISSVSANDINVEHLSIFFDHDLYYFYTVNIIVDLSKFTKLTRLNLTVIVDLDQREFCDSSWLMMVATIATIPVFSSSVSRISLSLCCKAQLPLEEYSVPITSNWAALLDALAKVSSLSHLQIRWCWYHPSLTPWVDDSFNLSCTVLNSLKERGIGLEYSRIPQYSVGVS